MENNQMNQVSAEPTKFTDYQKGGQLINKLDTFIAILDKQLKDGNFVMDENMKKIEVATQVLLKKLEKE